MAVEQIILENILKNSFPNAKIVIKDYVGDSDHYELTVITKDFAGKSKIEQHRMVNAVLKDVLRDQLHALSVKTQVEE